MTTVLTRPVLPERRERVVPVTIERASDVGGVLRVSGYAATFGHLSENLGGFVERLEPGCFGRALARPDCDLLLLHGHDRSRPLARQSAGSLRVTEDSKGLRFDAELVDTQEGRDVYQLVKSKIVKGCSFAFSYAADGGGVRWSQTEDGTPLAIVDEVGRLYELTLTVQPAYPSTSVEARNKPRNRGGRLKKKPICVYTPDSDHSFFRDLVEVEYADKMARDRRLAGNRFASPEAARLFAPRPNSGSIEAARERLATVEQQFRDLELEPTAFPGYVSDAFNVAARSKSAIVAALPSGPLPSIGMNLDRPRLSSGASVAVQPDQGDAVSETDPVETSTTLVVATVAGHVDIQRQSLERSTPALDVVISRDLGAALGTALDSQVLDGTGSNGQTAGLVGSATTTDTYTAGTPTGSGLRAALWDLAAQTAAAYGSGGESVTDLAIYAPRRLAWLASELGNDLSVLPGRAIVSGVVPTTDGAGTNEDLVVLIAGGALADQAVRVLSSATEIRVRPEVGSGTLTVRLSVYRYIVLDVLEPKAIGVLSGTGLATPSFS